MAAGRKAARAVQIGSDFYEAGATVPAEQVKEIDNPKVWAKSDEDDATPEDK